jgi:hypothetical protein
MAENVPLITIDQLEYDEENSETIITRGLLVYRISDGLPI